MNDATKIIAVTMAVIVFCLSSSAQNRSKKSSHPASDTILFEVLKKLSGENICGAAADSSDTFVGTVVKTNFADDELRLNGFVLQLTGDKRIFVNLDEEYISGRAASASSDLSDWLVKGRRIKVWTYRCRRILYAHRILGLLS
jgi:hypothetical protein